MRVATAELGLQWINEGSGKQQHVWEMVPGVLADGREPTKVCRCNNNSVPCE